MTGTAQTEEEEFREIYGMDVVVIPTNRPIQRIDQPDSIFKTKKEKLNAIVEQINISYKGTACACRYDQYRRIRGTQSYAVQEKDTSQGAQCQVPRA